MRQIRYQLWSVDPIDPNDERPLFGSYTLEACRRIIAVYNTRDRCHRLLIAKPVECQIPACHCYTCQIHTTKSDKVFVRKIQAADAYAAARDCIRRFQAGIDEVAVWLYDEDREAGALPVLLLHRDGKLWRARRIAS
jgi:hypothetical protein